MSKIEAKWIQYFNQIYRVVIIDIRFPRYIIFLFLLSSTESTKSKPKSRASGKKSGDNNTVKHHTPPPSTANILLTRRLQDEDSTPLRDNAKCTPLRVGDISSARSDLNALRTPLLSSNTRSVLRNETSCDNSNKVNQLDVDHIEPLVNNIGSDRTNRTLSRINLPRNGQSNYHSTYREENSANIINGLDSIPPDCDFIDNFDTEYADRLERSPPLKRRRNNFLFKRCFNQTFDPSNMTGFGRVLAHDSDTEE